MADGSTWEHRQEVSTDTALSFPGSARTRAPTACTCRAMSALSITDASFTFRGNWFTFRRNRFTLGGNNFAFSYGRFFGGHDI